MNLPSGGRRRRSTPAGRWWAALGPDKDLDRCGVVLTAEKLAEIRAHNTSLAKASFKAGRALGPARRSATIASRRGVQ